MIALSKRLWRDEDGVILSAELVLILTIGVLGLVVGLVNLQNALLGELNDLGLAFRSLNQSYSTPTFRGCWKYCALTSYTQGSCFVDVYDACYTQAEPCANGSAGCYGVELNNGNSCCQQQFVPQLQNTTTSPHVEQVLPARPQPGTIVPPPFDRP